MSDKKKDNKKLIQGMISVVVGIIIAVLPASEALPRQSLLYIGIFAWMLLTMIFNLFPAHITALMAVTLLLIFRVTTVSAAFVSFSSSTVWFVIGVFGFGAAISNSGLLNRISLHVLNVFPPSFLGQVSALTLTSVVLGPMIPSTIAKVSLLAPFASTIAKESGFEKGSRGAAGLFAAFFMPCTTFSCMFLTGSVTIPVMLSFITDRTHTFMSWLSATWVWGVFILVLSFLFIVIYYNPQRGGSSKGGDVAFAKQRLQELGPMTKNEKIAGIILVVTVLLWITESVHGYDTTTVVLLAFCALAMFGILTPQDFMTKISWPTIVIMGCILTIANLLTSLGISGWIADVLGPVLAPMINNVWLLIPVICIVVYILRYFIVSQMAVLTIMYAIFAPLAASVGINAFVIVFVTFMASNVWNLSFHLTAYLAAEAATGGNMIDHKSVVVSSYAYMVINLVACAASIPLWKIIGMIA